MERSVVLMYTKRFKGIISIILSLMILAGAVTIGTVTANAATAISVKIAKLTRRYSDARDVLTMINQYRTSMGRSSLVMDSGYLENAMVRAAQLSLYASEDCPDGQSGLRYITGASDGGQIVSYNVRSFSAMLNDMKNNTDSDSILLATNYNSVGVGVITVNSYKFVCVLASSKTPSAVSDSVLAQSGVETEQEVKVLPEHLSELGPAYSDGYGAYCGSSIDAFVKVRNQRLPEVSVYLTSYNASVSFSPDGVFQLKNGRALAVSPGETVMKISYNNGALSASCRIKAVGKSFSTCQFPQIPDQIYTGSPIKPKLVIQDQNGNTMVLGADFSVTYENNTNIGVATVHITGKGVYAGEKKDIKFNIISGGSNPDDYFGVTIQASMTTLSVGQSVKLSAVATGGTKPVTYTFSYSPYSASSWKTITSSTTSYCTFKPTEARAYNVRVSAKDSKGRTASQTTLISVSEPLKVTASFSPKTPGKGSSVKISTVATGGVKPLTYAYLVKKPSDTKWLYIKDYSAATTVTYKPSVEGTYQLCVKVKTASGTISKQFLDMKVKGTALTNKSTISKTSAYLGESVKLKAVASGGTAPYKYAFAFKRASSEGYTTAQAFGSQDYYVFTPQAKTTYSLCVMVKDASGIIEKKYFTLKVYSKLINNSKVSASLINPGKTLRMTAAASGGAGEYTYAFYFKKYTSTDLVCYRSFSTTKTVDLTLREKARYVIRIKVKDKAGNVTNKDFIVRVADPLKNTATVSATSVTAGKSIKVSCSASGGVAPYEYAVYYMKPGTDYFYNVSDYSSLKTRTVNIAYKGRYTLRIKVKDSIGQVVNKDIYVTGK